MSSKLAIGIFAFYTMASCTKVPPVASDTSTPNPTASPAATETSPVLPAETTTPIVVAQDPTPELSPTPSPPPVGLPSEKVSIIAPGPGSFVTSPVRVRGRAGPALYDRIEIRLVGEDGRLISGTFTYLYNIPGNLGPYNQLLEFTTPLVAEAARLEVYNYSRYDGKVDHMTSVNLTLLSIGASRVYYTLQGAEKLAIQSPREFATLEGGRVTIEGAGWIEADTPLKVEILDSNDEVVGSADAHLSTHQPGVAGTFEVEVPYSIDSPQRGRIAIYEPSTTIPGMIHYTSIIVQLNS